MTAAEVAAAKQQQLQQAIATIAAAKQQQLQQAIAQIAAASIQRAAGGQNRPQIPAVAPIPQNAVEKLSAKALDAIPKGPAENVGAEPGRLRQSIPWQAVAAVQPPPANRSRFRRGLSALQTAGRAGMWSIAQAQHSSERGVDAASSAVAMTGPVGAFAVAIAKAAQQLYRFTDETMKANEAYRGYSPGMASVFAQRDMQEAFRKMRMGGELTHSARDLMHEQQRLKNVLEPYAVKWQKFKNDVAKNTAGMFADIVEQAEDMGDAVWWGNLFRSKKNRRRLPSWSGGKPLPATSYAAGKQIFALWEAVTNRGKYATPAETGQDLDALTRRLENFFTRLQSGMKDAVADGAKDIWEKLLDLHEKAQKLGGFNFHMIVEGLEREAKKRKAQAQQRVRDLEQQRRG